VIAVFLQLGMTDTPLLRVALRSWVAFAEEALVDNVAGVSSTQLPDAEFVEFLVRTAVSVASSVDPARMPLKA